MSVERTARKVRDGGRVDPAEALELYREAPTHLLGSLADEIRARKHPERIVTYIIDRNVNYTNLCVARCNFCAFYRPVGSPDGYVLGFDEIYQKIDLGEEWTAMTGLPFIYAAWTGRRGSIGPDEVRALQEAQAEGVRSVEAIAAEYGRGDAAVAARASIYLRDNVRYGLGTSEAAGLQRFLDYAADLGLAPERRPLEFF